MWIQWMFFFNLIHRNELILLTKVFVSHRPKNVKSQFMSFIRSPSQTQFVNKNIEQS